MLSAIVLVVAACGGGGTGTAGPPQTTAAIPTAADGGEAPPSGTVEPATLALDLSKGAFVAAADGENAMRSRARSQADLVGFLGADASSVVAAIDRQGSDVLWKLVDGSTATGSGAMLAAVHRPSVPADAAPAVPPPGMSLLGPAVASMMLVDTSLGGTAYSQTTHDSEPVDTGTGKGSVTTDTTVAVTPAGDKLTVDVTTKTLGEANDAAGHLVFRINGTGHAHIEVQACPDAQGVVEATMEFQASEDYFVAAGGGRSGHSWNEDDKAHATIFANDEADLDHYVVDAHVDRGIKGGTKAAGAGQTDLTDSAVSAGVTATYQPNGTGTVTGGTFTGKDTTMKDVRDTVHGLEELVGIASQTTARAAEKFWRSGKCIEVVVDPKGGDVAADSKTSVSAKVRHRFDPGELQKPVVATLKGVKSIEPAGQKVPSPATFTYTAGANPKDSGEVTFKSVSNRGIGETSVTFSVGGGWKIDGHQAGQSITGQKCGGLDGVWRIDGQLGDAQVKTTSTYIATLDGTTLVGTYTFKSVGTVDTGIGLIVTTQTGTGKVTAVKGADGTVTMTMAGTTVTGTAEGAGTAESVDVAIPPIDFVWQPGGTCPT